jgi:hypothetical protein
LFQSHKHLEYDAKTKQNDLAILKLKDSVNLNQFVQLICLPLNKNSNLEDDGQSLTMMPTVIGWSISNESSISSESISDVLEEATVTVLNNSICNKNDDLNDHKWINETINQKNSTQTNHSSIFHFINSPPKQISNQSQLICTGIKI